MFYRCKVLEVMSTPAVYVPVHASLSDALALMTGRNIRQLPVISDEGPMVGMLRESDVREALRSGIDATVEAVMRPCEVIINPDATLREAAHRMREYGVTELPVVMDGIVVGVITASDMIRRADQESVDNLLARSGFSAWNDA
ncbi:MAG: CBS domain-containing protein [Myxococcaceae bacterium]